jgi:hypothetical protein
MKMGHCSFPERFDFQPGDHGASRSVSARTADASCSPSRRSWGWLSHNDESDPQARCALTWGFVLLPRLVSIQIFEIQSCRRPVRTGPREALAHPGLSVTPARSGPGRPPRSTPFVSKSVSKSNPDLLITSRPKKDAAPATPVVPGRDPPPDSSISTTSSRSTSGSC